MKRCVGGVLYSGRGGAKPHPRSKTYVRTESSIREV